MLNTLQLEIIGELVDSAMDKVVQSLEMMLNIPLQKDRTVYGNGSLAPVSEFDELGRFKVNIVKVAFTGDLNGGFYFIINAHELDTINAAALPEGMDNATITARKMKKGFIQEIENMMAALTMTEIADFLGVQLEGAVPKMEVMPGEDVNMYLQEENLVFKTAFHVKSIFSGRGNVSLSPYFIWLLDQNFVNQLKMNTVT